MVFVLWSCFCYNDLGTVFVVHIWATELSITLGEKRELETYFLF